MTEEEVDNLTDSPALTLPIVQQDQRPKNTAVIPQDQKQDHDRINNVDRVNNIKQKESALHKAGVTREKAFRVVAKSLEAKKWADVIDRQGNVKQEWVDDLDKQRWAAEMVAKYFGDFVTTKETESNGIRQLVIIRPSSDGTVTEAGDRAGGRSRQTEAKGISRPVHIQHEDVSGDVELMGHGKNDVIDISGNAIQRADTE